jgi:hypothetical protein
MIAINAPHAMSPVVPKTLHERSRIAQPISRQCFESLNLFAEVVASGISVPIADRLRLHAFGFAVTKTSRTEINSP